MTKKHQPINEQPSAHRIRNPVVSKINALKCDQQDQRAEEYQQECPMPRPSDVRFADAIVGSAENRRCSGNVTARKTIAVLHKPERARTRPCDKLLEPFTQ